MTSVFNTKRLQEFKDVYESEGKFNLAVQVPYLLDLAEHYIKRFESTNHWADALKSHALYISCHVRDGNVQWLRRAYDIQRAYWNGEVNISYKDQEKFTQKLKRQLRRIRIKVKANLNGVDEAFNEKSVNSLDDVKDLETILCEQTPDIMAKSTDMMTQLADTLITYAIGLYNNNESYKAISDQFCTVGLGPIAQKETTPYCPFNFLFLIPHDSYAQRDIFKKLLITCNFLITNLGESKLTCFDITELMEHNWFSDESMCGFRTDGLPKRMEDDAYDSLQIHSISNSVITMDELAYYYESVYEDQESYYCVEDFCDMLASTSYKFICGNESLYQNVQHLTPQVPPAEAVQQAHARMVADNFDELYVDSAFLLFTLKTVFNVPVTLPLELIKNLSENGKISKSLANGLEVLYCASQYVRQASHAHHGTQRIDVTNFTTNQTTSKIRLSWTLPQSLHLLFEMYTLPVKRQMKQGLRDDRVLLQDRESRFTFALAAVKFKNQDYNNVVELLGGAKIDGVEKDIKYKYIESLIMSNQYSAAEKSLNTDLSTETVDQVHRAKLCMLYGLLHEKLGNLDEALSYEQKALINFQKTYSDIDHIDVADTISRIGRLYSDMGQHEEALDNENKALSIQLRINAKGVGLASSYNKMGSIYSDIGNYSKALEFHNQALDAYVQCYGNIDHPDIATTYNHLGSTYAKQENLSTAQEYYHKAISIYMKVDDAIGIANVYRNIGFICKGRADFHQALEYYKRALEYDEKAYGELSRPESGVTYNNIGTIYQMRGDLKTALEHYNKALSFFAVVYGSREHPNIAEAYANVGSAYKDQGNFAMALGFFNKALSIYKNVYGDVSHPSTAKLYNSIGLTHDCQGDYNAALENYNTALDIWKTSYGDTVSTTLATIYNNIGAVHDALGNINKALEDYNKALYIKQKIYGDIYHPNLAVSYNNIGSLYRDLGDYEKAFTNFKRAFSINKKIFENQCHPRLALSYYNIASVNAKLGDLKTALENSNIALTLRKRLYGDTDHPDLATAYDGVGSVYQLLGEHGKALYYSKQALLIRQCYYANKPHPDTATSLHNVGAAYELKGDLGRARESYKQSLALRLAVYGQVCHLKIAESYSKIGLVQYKQRDLSKALESYNKALSIQLDLHKKTDHVEIAETYGSIGKVYEGLGDHERALDSYRKSLSIYKKVHGDADNADTVRLHKWIGILHQRNGDYTKALHNYNIALSIDLKLSYGDDHFDTSTFCDDIATAWNDKVEF